MSSRLPDLDLTRDDGDPAPTGGVSALGHVPRSRLLGLAALAILAVATSPLTLIAGIAASTAVLAIAIADTVRGMAEVKHVVVSPA